MFYKFVLILPPTQTTCERVLLALKVVKTKPRSALNQEFVISSNNYKKGFIN